VKVLPVELLLVVVGKMVLEPPKPSLVVKVSSYGSGVVLFFCVVVCPATA